eukprot:COSAG04_NODE_1164_length_8013_cov_11.222517_2_plen_138_part_00
MGWGSHVAAGRGSAGAGLGQRLAARPEEVVAREVLGNRQQHDHYESEAGVGPYTTCGGGGGWRRAGGGGGGAHVALGDLALGGGAGSGGVEEEHRHAEKGHTGPWGAGAATSSAAGPPPCHVIPLQSRLLYGRVTSF